jgi:hypothetical protein
MLVWAYLLSGMLAVSPTAKRLDRVDSAAEDLFDHVVANQWHAAEGDLKRLRGACSREQVTICAGQTFAGELRALDHALKARARVPALQSANAITFLLAPELDAAEASKGIAPLDPAVRRIFIDAERDDLGSALTDIQNLKRAVAQVRCPASSLAAFDSPLRRADSAAKSGDLALLERQVAALDESVDRLERACLGP